MFWRASGRDASIVRSTSRTHGAPHSGQHPRSDEPARMHRRASSSGNVAKCASGYGWVAISHTLRTLRPAGLTRHAGRHRSDAPRSGAAVGRPHRPARPSSPIGADPYCVLLPHRFLVEEIPRPLRQQEHVLVRLRRPVRHRFRHRVRLRPDDVGAEVPAVGLERERDPPRDTDQILRLQVVVPRAGVVFEATSRLPHAPVSTSSRSRGVFVFASGAVGISPTADCRPPCSARSCRRG